MRNLLFLVVVAAAFAGCFGGIDSGDGRGDGDLGSGASEARKRSKELFDANVYPAVQARCGACHAQARPLSASAPGFVATEPANGYTLVAGDPVLLGDLTPATAKLLVYGQDSHQSAAYGADQVTKITEWLAAEIQARKDGGPESGPAALRAKIEDQWSACMTLENFTAAKMVIWANVNTNDGNNNASCQSCHNTGYAGFTANGVAESGFGIIATDRRQMRQYFTIDSATAPTKMLVNLANLTSVSIGADVHIGHRPFNLTNGNGLVAMTALNAFHATTAAAVAAGNCGPTKLVE